MGTVTRNRYPQWLYDVGGVNSTAEDIECNGTETFLEYYAISGMNYKDLSDGKEDDRDKIMKNLQ